MRLLLLCAMFLASGASALIFEALWFHQASLAFGGSVWASSLVLAAFMAGLALGGYLCARIAHRIRAALFVYAGVELLIAVSGIVLVIGLPRIGEVLAPVLAVLSAFPALLHATRFLFAFLLLLIPSTAIGMTLPLLMHALSAGQERFGSRFGLLYGVNTLGAVGGVLITELWLLSEWGVVGAAYVAGAFNLGAALLALACARSADALAPQDAPIEPAAWRGRRILGAAFLSGFLLLALEVVWLRLLMLFLNDTPAAFAMLLAAVLGGIALGGLLASAALRWRSRTEGYASPIAYGAGLFALLSYMLFPGVVQRYLTFEQAPLSIMAVVAPLVMPTAIASGMLFTVLAARLRRVSASDALTSGRLAWVNTLGAGAGSLVAGFVLLPRFGMEWSLFALFALYGLVGLLLVSARDGVWARRLSALGFVAALALFPFGDVREVHIRRSAQDWMGPHDTLLEVREGLTATIAHIRHGLHGVALSDQLVTNAYSMSANDCITRRYMDMFVTLPVAVHPHVQRALLIGYGIGTTAQALVRTREIERIDIVDISHDMLALSRRAGSRGAAHPLDDPRVRVHIEDGRYFLLSTEQRFDLITGEPPPPIIAGVSNLYSREYFQLVHDRLADDGIATYWLPMMNLSAATGLSIVKAFCEAFSDCSLWHGSARNFMLMGSRAARKREPVSAEHFAQQFSDAAPRQELVDVGLEEPAQLGALFIGDAAYLATLTEHAVPLADDWPKRMYQAGSREERDALLWKWRDTTAARERFATSPLIARLWPAALRGEGPRQFENQRLINDLLFPGDTAARQSRILHQVLFGTHLRFPVLLLLGSNTDVQRALGAMPAAQREREAWLPHRAAGHLADRDFAAALPLLERTPDALLPLPDLRTYVAYALSRRAILPTSSPQP